MARWRRGDVMEDGFYYGARRAVVESYDPVKRMCRVSIAGLTDGSRDLPYAEIMYPIGDKSKGSHETEIEILVGDKVWVEFEGGDPRYPIIVGWRNPTSGNSVGTRRWHSPGKIHIHADGEVTVQGDGKVIVLSPTVEVIASTSVTFTTPQATFSNKVTVNGLFTFNKGMSSGGSGANGAKVSVNGIKVDYVDCSITSNGKPIDHTHTHTEQGDGNKTSPVD